MTLSSNVEAPETSSTPDRLLLYLDPAPTEKYRGRVMLILQSHGGKALDHAMDDCGNDFNEWLDRTGEWLARPPQEAGFQRGAGLWVWEGECEFDAEYHDYTMEGVWREATPQEGQDLRLGLRVFEGPR